MKRLSKIQLWIYNCGGVLLLIGAMLPMIGDLSLVVPCIYSVGTLMFVSMQYLQMYNGKNITLVRLRRQQILGCVMLLITGGLMFFSYFNFGPLRNGEWMISLSIGALLEVYTAFRIPMEMEKEK